MVAHVRSGGVASPWIRGTRTRTQLCAPRTVFANVRAGQLDHRQLHHARQLFSYFAPPIAPELSQTIDSDDAKIVAAT